MKRFKNINRFFDKLVKNDWMYCKRKVEIVTRYEIGSIKISI